MSATASLASLRNAQLITGAKEWTRTPVVTTTVSLAASDKGALTSATWAISAQGLYEATINGQQITDSLFNPGWTSYEWRIQYQEFDVLSLLQQAGEEATLDITIGNGWFRGNLGFNKSNINYGDEIGAIAALTLTYQNGDTETIVTDESWKAFQSDITMDSLYNGQHIDFRLAEERELADVRVLEFNKDLLIPQEGLPVTRHEIFKPQKIWTSPSGKTLIDFGQNLVGWVRFTTTGEAGQTITIRHAEVLEHEELGTRPLREAQATDVITLSGATDTFEPRFTFHGFRYVEVEGWPGELTEDSLEAVVVHSDMKRTGYFESSHEMLNQLVHNSVWGQKGNFLDVPTDCPQRDERMGWTGDIAAYAASASYQFDTSQFLNKWLEDLRIETEAAKGVVPNVVPDLLKYVTIEAFGDADREKFTDAPSEGNPFADNPTAIWGDSAVWVPEALWNAYADKDALAQQYPAMVEHLSAVAKKIDSDGIWRSQFQFGDWLDPDAAPDDPADAKADRDVVATLCLYRSASFVAQAAEVLGKVEDVEKYREMATNTREALHRKYIDQETGIIYSDCATVYALAIAFGVVEDGLKEKAGEHLARCVRERDYRISTGFAGTPFVTWGLSETGHVEDAYKVLLETGCPSWLYTVSMGATTIWERWDSMLEDGTINPGEMTSFNHYALGAVVDWVYQVIAGIRPAAPGYAEVLIKPVPGVELDWAKGSYESRHGLIVSEWKREGSTLTFTGEVPTGVSARIELPNGEVHEISGSYSFEVAQ